MIGLILTHPAVFSSDADFMAALLAVIVCILLIPAIAPILFRYWRWRRSIRRTWGAGRRAYEAYRRGDY
jgi:hypothetical protein